MTSFKMVGIDNFSSFYGTKLYLVSFPFLNDLLVKNPVLSLLTSSLLELLFNKNVF